MANVPCVLSARLLDGQSVRRTSEAYIDPPDTTTLAQLATLLNNWLTALDAVTDGAITNTGITVKATLPTGLKPPSGTAWTASNVNKVGLLRFNSSGTTHRWSNVIPSIAQSSIVNGKITTTGASMGTYTALFTTTANNYSNPDSQAITTLYGRAISDRTTRQQSISKSFELG